MDSYTAQVVVVVVLRPTVSPSPGELNFVPHIWVKVTEDSKRKNGEWKGWWVVGGCRGLIHARFPTLTVVGGASPSACASDWFGWGQRGVFEVGIIE